jgi:uncharacterized protein YjbJ (UPF0337 family)
LQRERQFIPVRAAPSLQRDVTGAGNISTLHADRFRAAKALANRPASCSGKRPKGTHIDMNWDRVEGNWKQMKGKAREKWGKLTDNDFEQIAGKKDQLVGRIQERYGISKDEASKQVDEWSRLQTEEEKQHTKV